MAEEYIRLNLDILNSDLSPRAIILYSFLETRIEYSKFKHEGKKYIIPSGSNNPETALGYSDRTIKRLKKELINKGFIYMEYVEHSGRYKAVFLNDGHVPKMALLKCQNCHLKSDKTDTLKVSELSPLKCQNCHPSLYIKEKQKEKEKNNKKDGAPTSEEIYIPTDEQIEEVLKKL